MHSPIKTTLQVNDYAETDAAGGHTHTVTIGNTGGGLGHSNYQPGRGIYYIVYKP